MFSPCVGVFLQFSSARFASELLCWHFLIIFLAIFTQCSAFPLAYWWYGEEKQCSNWYEFLNYTKVSDLKHKTLSLINLDGIPYLAKCFFLNSDYLGRSKTSQLVYFKKVRIIIYCYQKVSIFKIKYIRSNYFPWSLRYNWNHWFFWLLLFKRITRFAITDNINNFSNNIRPKHQVFLMTIE